MKKMVFTAFALVIGMMALATETAYVQIRLTGESGQSSNVFITEDDAHTTAFEPGVDTEKMMSQANSKSVLLYGIVGSTYCEDVVSNDLTNLKIGFTTNQVDQNYTLTFIDKEGGTIKLKDLLTDTEIDLGSATSYNFSVAAGLVGRHQVLDRFVINYHRDPDTGDLEICHKDNQLQLLNNPYTANIVIKDSEGTEVKNVPSTNTPQYIDLSDLAAGQYTVELNNGNRSFIIKK